MSRKTPEIFDIILKATNEGNVVCCVIVDFRKAFDLVDHEILLRKLQSYKCNDCVYLGFNLTYVTEHNVYL